MMWTVTPQLTFLLMENVIIVAIKAILQAYAEAEDLKDNLGTAQNYTKPVLTDTKGHTVD